MTQSRLMAMGVDATKTIGLAGPQCALRFEHGCETVAPPRLREIIAE